jgi:alkylation response protein AidB-like acyl-CoA dehydrogenase
MTAYAAPIRDMRFVMRELAGLDRVCGWPAFADATPELVDAIVDEAGRFGAEVLAPLNAIGDRQGARWRDGVVTLPDGFREAWRMFADAGWQGLSCDARFGGQGLPKLVGAAVQEIWKGANHAWSIAQALTLGGIEALLANGSPEQQALYIPRLASGEWSATMNLTEPQAGSDLSKVRTRAIRQPDGSFRIFGQKVFISFGEHDMTGNIVHFVLARTEDAPQGTKGVSLFLVPKFLVNPDGSPGARNDLACVSIEHKLGLHGSPTCTMSFGDGGGAIGHLVGSEHEGLKCMFTMMNSGRVSAGLEGLAVAERATQQALAYARGRIQGQAPGGPPEGVPIVRHPDVRRMLMQMRSRVEAMRAFAYWVAAAQDAAAHHPDASERERSRRLVDLMTPVVKGWCTETGLEVAQLGIQVHGGTGYVEETGAAQHMRDVRISSIYEGTTGIQANDLVGRKIARDGGEAVGGVLALMRETVGDLAGIGARGEGAAALSADLAAIAAALEQALGALSASVEHIVANHDRDWRGVAVGAVPFLHLMGIACGGWMMARAAHVAALRVAGGEGDPFYAAKIASARFYADHVLVHAAGYAQTVRSGTGAAMAIPEDLL